LKAGHPNSEDVMRQAFLRSFFYAAGISF